MVLLDITERAKTVRTETLRMLRWFMCFSWTAQWPHGRFKDGARAKGSLQRKENLRRLRVMASSNLIGCAYFARFQTSTAAGPPTDGAVFVYLSSSPARRKFVR